jgi:hypothetical protein
VVNKIEIVVNGRNDMPATFAEVKAQASALGATAGGDAGGKFSSTFSSAVKDQLGPKIQDPIKESGKTSGNAFTSAFTGQLASGLSSTGVFGGSIGDAIGKQGAPAGKKFGATFSESAKQAMVGSTLAGILAPTGDVGAPMVQDAAKTGDKVGKDAGAAAAQGMSPLIIGAIGGAAAIGAPLLLAGLGVAFVGITALALSSNKVIAADYKKLGTDAENSLKQAAAPLAGTMNQAVVSLDGSLKSLQPQLDSLFANAGPDITSFETGVAGLVSGMLPGLSQALGSSQVIVKDFSTSMGPLGSSVGSFFTGLTTDATTTGAGLQSVLGVLGNTVSTLGTMLGSASSGISAALIGIDPAINGLMSGIRGISNPATVTGMLGAFGAMKLDPAISGGLTKAREGMLSLGAKAENAGGVLGKFSGAALSSGTGLSKMADVMDGPWGIAIGAGVGLLSGLAGMLYESAHASDALTLSQQGLTDAVAKDGGNAGAATAAYVAQTAAANGLAQTAANAGVSMTTWTEAVLGSKQAQDAVIASVNTANQVVQNQKLASDEASTSTGKFSGELHDAETAAQGAAAANNTYTDKNKQLIASMNAETKQVADAIAAQTLYEQAMNAVTNTKQLFNATLTAGYNSLVANTQATSMNTLAALDLGSGSYSLNQQLYQSVDAYNQAQTEGNAYLSVLDSMSGTINSLLGAEAAFTTSLARLTTSVKTNGTSLDQNNTKGAANITVLTEIANAANKAAGAVYDNERQTQGATKAFNDANNKLTQEKAAFIANADAAGMNKGQVASLANELFQLPSNVNIPINADTTAARNSLYSFINLVQSSTASVRITGPAQAGYASGGAVSFAASGGAQGGFTWMNEQGPELVRLPTGAQVMPAANTASMLASGHGSGGSSSQTEVVFGGDTSGAFASAFMLMIRQGKIQIKQKAIVP